MEVNFAERKKKGEKYVILVSKWIIVFVGYL